MTLDPSKRNLRAVLRGYWDEATAANYVAELNRSVAALDRSAGMTYWLIDVTDFSIQAIKVAEIVSPAVSSVVTDNAVIAVATTNMLGSLQAQRTAAGHKHRRFDTVADAEAWLAEMRDSE